MKRRTGILAGVFICILCVCAVGFVRRQHTTSESQTSEKKTENEEKTEQTSETDSASEEEKEFFAQVAADQEVEQRIFEAGAYQSYGGFGYRVTGFTIYDDYEDFSRQTPNYDPEKEERLLYDPRFPEEKEVTEIACVEIEVTNEKDSEQEFFTSRIQLVVGDNGKLYNWDYEADGSKYTADLVGSENPFYVEGVEHPASEKNYTHPLMQPGETVTLKLFFGYYAIYCIGEDKPENVVLISIQDALDNPEYYVQIEGEMPANSAPDYITDDKMHIFFRVQ